MEDSSPAADAGAAPEARRPWEQQIQIRTQHALNMGGPGNVARQHERGQMTARERLEVLIDGGSWREIGRFTGKAVYDCDHALTDVTPANAITGTAKIEQRDVAVVAEDFTVRGGSSEATSPEKWQYVERLALQYRMPLVRLVETAGGSVNLLKQAGATKIPGYPDWPLPSILETVPVAAVALGSAAGLGAVRVICSHFSVMVAGSSYVFAGGPAVVKPGVGEDVTKEELGGSTVHARGSGVVDNEAGSEEDALAQVRSFLSYLPSSVFEIPPVAPSADDPDRREETLADAVPTEKRRSYQMRKILSAVFDRDSMFEIGRYNGRSQITALARLNGYPVAVLANDPVHLGGALTAESSEKIIRFVDMANTFNLPVINFVDQPGTYVGTKAEAKGTVRKGVRAQIAIEQTSVPWASIFVRRAFGLAGSAYAPLTGLTNWRIAWPTAYWGSIPIEGGVEAAYAREIAQSDDPDGLREQLVEDLQYLENPFLTAEKFGVNDIIDPRETRPILCDWVRQAYRILPEQLGQKAHGFRP